MCGDEADLQYTDPRDNAGILVKGNENQPTKMFITKVSQEMIIS